MNTYAQNKLVEAAKAGKTKKRLGNHWMERLEDGTVLYGYFDTTICQENTDGTVFYNDGGYKTSSTRRALSRYDEILGGLEWYKTTPIYQKYKDDKGKTHRYVFDHIYEGGNIKSISTCNKIA